MDPSLIVSLPSKTRSIHLRVILMRWETTYWKKINHSTQIYWYPSDFLHWYTIIWASLVAQCESICLQCRRCRKCRFHPWIRTIPWRRKWQPTPGFLPREFHRIPVKPGRLQPMGSQRVRHDWALTHTHIHCNIPEYFIYSAFPVKKIGTQQPPR